MESLPTVECSYKNLHEMVMAPIKSRLVMTGLELGVFDEMDTPRSARDIAAAIGSHTKNTERFLNALATIGLVEKKEGLYRNRLEAATYLTKIAPTYLGPFFQLLQRMCVDTLEDLGDVVKNGPAPRSPNHDFSSESLWAEATFASAGWVAGGVGRQMAYIVSSLPEFTDFRRMLDLGGGHGMFALYFINAHTNMTGVVFDQSAVVSVAQRFIQQYGMQDRVTVAAGDYLADDIGSDYDFIWASATLNFVRHDLDRITRKIFDALNPGGIFISFQDGMTHEQTQPDIMLGHLGEAMRSGLDLFFDQGEICQSMLRCGFRSVQSRTVKTPMGEMDLDIARK